MCLKNYGLAVLGVPVRPFFCAMLSIELWNTFELCFLGSAAAHIGAEADTLRDVSLAVACLLIVVLALYGCVLTRRALAEVRRQDGDAPPPRGGDGYWYEKKDQR